MQFEQLFEQRVVQEDEKFDRVIAFKQANASQALEGLVMSEHDIAMQQKVVNGEISSESAINEYVRLFSTAR